MTHKLNTVVVPPSKQGWEKGALLKSKNGIFAIAPWSYEKTENVDSWQVQQLYLVSERPICVGDWFYAKDEGVFQCNVVKRYDVEAADGRSRAGYTIFGKSICKRIEATYPETLYLPTISTSDMQRFCESGGSVEWEMEMEEVRSGSKLMDNIMMLDKHPIFAPRIENGCIVLKEVEKVETSEPTFDIAKQLGTLSALNQLGAAMFGENTAVKNDLIHVEQTDKTPLQMLMDELVEAKKNADKHENYTADYRAGVKRGLGIAMNIIAELLPAERQFAKKCFEAGEQKGTSDMAKSRTAPDFSKFYENYER